MYAGGAYEVECLTDSVEAQRRSDHGRRVDRAVGEGGDGRPEFIRE